MARGRCELVCAITPGNREIGHTVRSTGAYVRKFREVTLCGFIEVHTERSQDRTHVKVSSTYVFVHKCVEEECRIARRSDRTHCTQYRKGVGSNYEFVNVMEMRDHKHGKLKYFETATRYAVK